MPLQADHPLCRSPYDRKHHSAQTNPPFDCHYLDRPRGKVEDDADEDGEPDGR
jgi:hypothetical protein